MKPPPPADEDHVLPRTLAIGHLVVLGVSLAVAGSFGAWGIALGNAGWGGVLLCFMLVMVFYGCLVIALSGLTKEMPQATGGQDFAVSTLGASAGFIVGSAAAVEFLCSCAVLAVLAAGYLHDAAGVPTHATILALFLLVFIAQLRGARETMAFTFALASLTALGLIVFVLWMGASAAARPSLPPAGALDAPGIWLALPFVVPFFIGIEGLALASADAVHPARDLPRAMMMSLLIVASLGLGVLLSAPAAVGTAPLVGTAGTISSALSANVSMASSPLGQGIRMAGFAGLCASFFGVFYASARQLHAMSVTGDLPPLLARVNRRGAPTFSTVFTSGVGAALAFLGTIDELIVITVTAAIIFYLMMFLAFIARPAGGRARHSLSGRWLVGSIGIFLGAVLFLACLATNPLWTALALIIVGFLAFHRSVMRHRRRPTFDIR